MFHLSTLPVCFDLPLWFMRFTCEFHLIARSSARSHERNEIPFIENETFVENVLACAVYLFTVRTNVF